MLTKIEGLVLYAVLSLSGCLTLSVESHAIGRESLGSLRNIGECRAKANKAKGPERLNKPSEGKA